MPSFVDVSAVATPSIANIAASDTIPTEEMHQVTNEEETVLVVIQDENRNEDPDFFEAQATKKKKGMKKQTVASRAKKGN